MVRARAEDSDVSKHRWHGQIGYVYAGIAGVLGRGAKLA